MGYQDAGEPGWTRGQGPPMQTHSERQLKKATGPRGKVQTCNNQALFVIGSMCAVGVSKRVSERGEAGREVPWISLERGFRLHVFCPPPLFLPALPRFKVERSRE